VLAQAGYPAARIDLPGTGDSDGSPRDPGRLDAWTGAVTDAARWLRERSGCGRVVGLGLGLGGLLVWRAAATGAPIDDLALWAVPDAGRRLVREIRIETGMVGGEEAPRSSGDFDAIGYVLTPETLADLEALKLAELPLPGPERRRALVLSRRGLGSDLRVVPMLEAAGVEVRVADVPGWDELMDDPEKSRPPLEAIEQTLAWLADDRREPEPGDAAAAGPPVPARTEIELSVGGRPIRESVLAVSRESLVMRGVLAEPVAPAAPPPFCAVLLNAAGIRHTGPNRTWTEISRRWAARGVPTLRLDLEGFGDSDGDGRTFLEPGGPYDPDLIAQMLFALDGLERRGLPHRYAALGLCTSAYLAMHAALHSDRIAALFLMNQSVIFWDPELVDEDLTIKALESLRGRTWQKLRSGDVTLQEIRAQLRKLRLGRIVASVRKNADRRDRTDDAFDRLREQGTETLFVFGQHEPLYDRLVRDGQLARLDRWPNVRVAHLTPTNERVPAGDHTFRALSLQSELHAAVDEALERALARHAGG
jgi:pimeloyl-ACP methyl ester carboxylesterase